MANIESPITKRGQQEVQTELESLIRNDREEIKQAISEARALGDLSENAEYQYAKEKQSHIEGRISHLQGILATSRVIEIGKINSQKIVFGATVTLFDAAKDTTLTYQIVGNDEADINKGRVSFLSPLGKALMGKEEGDEVIVKAPKGDIEYEVESFEFIE
ncbi:MAG: transcription elongation factor GreA [Bacteriovoracaceae bacterium]|nr:transcription elongation factor GreA [Bacteriovoracaceae bacterium]